MISTTLQVGIKILAVHNDKFLVLRRSGVAYSNVQGTMWDIPGGRIDPTLSLYDNLQREICEEVGLEYSADHWETSALLGAQDIWVEKKDLHVIRLTYAGRVEGSIKLSNEHEEYALATFDELLTMFDEANLIGQLVRTHAAHLRDMLRV